LARAISTVLRNTGLAASLGRTGRERVIQWFSQDRMVRETENLYLKILNRPMRARAVQGFA
jgi:glycosyltransferase involved in cell wall biosynthesis